MSKPKLPEKNFEWTAKLAYAIGLITTDGSLAKDGRHIVMRSSDVQLLETFKECLNISANITETFNDGFAKKRSYRVQASMVQFYRWLLKIGLTPAKTYTIGELQIPDEYFRDFLRGHLDGDGSISSYQDYYNTYKNPKYVYIRLWVRFISVSKLHIDWLRSRIFALLGTKGHIWVDSHPTLPNRVPMWVIKFGKKDSIRLLNWMYYNPDVPCLDRKRQKAEKFLSTVV